MYKFNYLNKINQEKQKTKEINHLISFVFYSALSLSVIFILIMVFKSLIVGGSFKEISSSLKDITAQTDKLHSSPDYFSTEKINKFYDYQMKRVTWTGLLNSLESNVDANSSIDEMVYNGSQLDCKVLVKVNEENNNLAHVKTLMAQFQEKLSKDSVFVTFLKDNSDKSISAIEQPNLDQTGGSGIWYYRMQFTLRAIVQPAAAATDDNSKRRF